VSALLHKNCGRSALRFGPAAILGPSKAMKLARELTDYIRGTSK
jgi:hypothetical protein